MLGILLRVWWLLVLLLLRSIGRGRGGARSDRAAAAVVEDVSQVHVGDGVASSLLVVLFITVIPPSSLCFSLFDWRWCFLHTLFRLSKLCLCRGPWTKGSD